MTFKVAWVCFQNQYYVLCHSWGKKDLISLVLLIEHWYYVIDKICSKLWFFETVDILVFLYKQHKLPVTAEIYTDNSSSCSQSLWGQCSINAASSTCSDGQGLWFTPRYNISTCFINNHNAIRSCMSLLVLLFPLVNWPCSFSWFLDKRMR